MVCLVIFPFTLILFSIAQAEWLYEDEPVEEAVPENLDDDEYGVDSGGENMDYVLWPDKKETPPLSTLAAVDNAEPVHFPEKKNTSPSSGMSDLVGDVATTAIGDNAAVNLKDTFFPGLDDVLAVVFAEEEQQGGEETYQRTNAFLHGPSSSSLADAEMPVGVERVTEAEPNDPSSTTNGLEMNEPEVRISHINLLPIYRYSVFQKNIKKNLFC